MTDSATEVEDAAESARTAALLELPNLSRTVLQKQKLKIRLKALQETLAKHFDEDPAKPATDPFARLTESPLDLSKSAWKNKNAKRIPVEDILAAFPSEEAWRKSYDAALLDKMFARKRIMAWILSQSCSKNCEMPRALQRGRILNSNIDKWPYNAFPLIVRQNQVDWLNWMAELEATIPNALRQNNWITLLEREFKATEPVWKRFWELINDLNAARKASEITPKTMPSLSIPKELAEIEVKMADFNRRRQFLQAAIHYNMAWEAELYKEEPLVLDWEAVVKAMVMEVGTGGELQGSEIEQVWEGGRVLELDDTESNDEE